jgi:adenosylcobyric acid synthase
VVAGLGLLPVRVTFGTGKVLGRPRGTGYGAAVRGYEIHHGVTEVAEGRGEPFPGGCRTVAVWGTTWHGTLENDQFRRAFLTEVAALAGREFTVAPDTSFAAARQARLDTLADLVAGHLDTAAVSRLIEHGPPPGLPVIPPAGVR